MLEVYLLRHGQTLFNKKDMVQGWCDSPLTARGIKQAQEAGEKLKEVPFTLAFSSPSERAYQTCEYALKQRLAIKTDRRLKEMYFGEFEGEMNEVLKKKQAVGNQFDWTNQGGENKAMVTARIAAFLADLAHQYDDEIILVASHGMWIAYCLEYVAKDFKNAFFLGNGEIAKINYDNNQWQIESIEKGDKK